MRTATVRKTQGWPQRFIIHSTLGYVAQEGSTTMTLPISPSVNGRIFFNDRIALARRFDSRSGADFIVTIIEGVTNKRFRLKVMSFEEALGAKCVELAVW